MLIDAAKPVTVVLHRAISRFPIMPGQTGQSSQLSPLSPLLLLQVMSSDHKPLWENAQELELARQQWNTAVTERSERQSQLQEYQLEVESTTGAEAIAQMEADLQGLVKEAEQSQVKVCLHHIVYLFWCCMCIAVLNAAVLYLKTSVLFIFSPFNFLFLLLSSPPLWGGHFLTGPFLTVRHESTLRMAALRAGF